MARERTSSAFKGLLSGVNFMRGIQGDQKEEERYQDAQDFRNEDFEFRKSQAKEAAGRWKEEFAQKTAQFEEEHGLGHEKIALNKDILAETILQNKANNQNTNDSEDISRYNAESYRMSLNAGDRERERQRKLNSSFKDVSKIFKDSIGDNYSQVSLTKPEDYIEKVTPKPEGGWQNFWANEKSKGSALGTLDDWTDISGMDFDNKEAAKEMSNKANAQILAAPVMKGKLSKVIRGIDEALAKEGGEEWLRTSDQAAVTIADAAAQIQMLYAYIDKGYITDEKVKRDLRGMAARIMPYILEKQYKSGQTAQTKLMEQEAKYSTEFKYDAELEKLKFGLKNPED